MLCFKHLFNKVVTGKLNNISDKENRQISTLRLNRLKTVIFMRKHKWNFDVYSL